MSPRYIIFGRMRRGLLVGLALVVGSLLTVALPPYRMAQAASVVSGDTGVAQGALVDKPLDYQTKVLDSTVASGAKWIRLDLWWFQIEANQGTYTNWTKFDNLYRLAKDKGLNILVVVSGAPTWASGCSDINCPPDTAHVQQWKNFLTTAVNRYKTAEFNVSTYEIWNEPNITRFYQTPSASTYTNQVLKPAYEAITAALPTATVITGGTSPASTSGGNIAPWQFIQGIYAAGGKNYFHHIAHHPYVMPDAPLAGNASWNSFLQMDQDYPATGVVSIRTTMATNQDSAKKIWATEIGYATHPTSGTCTTYSWDNNVQRCVTEADQAKMLARVYNEWAKRDYAGKIFWYSMVDDSAAVPSDPNSRENHFGLLHSDYSAKPAYSDFSKIVSEKYAWEMLNNGTDPNPKHYWKLGELGAPGTNDTAVDVMNASANGTYSTGVVKGTNNVVVGTAAPEFDAPGDSVNVSYNDEFIRLAWNAWTVEFSARRVDGAASWPGIMGKGNPQTADGWAIYEHRAGGGFLSFKRNNVECRTTSSPLADATNDVAHHFAVTYYQNEVIWYVDGVRDGSCSNINFPVPSTVGTTFRIGASGETSGSNAVGHVAIWNYRLSSSRIQAHANARVALP